MSIVVIVMSFILVSFATVSNDAYAEDKPEKITPYGEDCPLCGEYGYCSKQPTREEAVEALKLYFGRKGLNIIILKPRDRFLEIGVYRNGNLVDRVLVDLRTGRMRSVY